MKDSKNEFYKSQADYLDGSANFYSIAFNQ